MFCRHGRLSIFIFVDPHFFCKLTCIWALVEADLDLKLYEILKTFRVVEQLQSSQEGPVQCN